MNVAEYIAEQLKKRVEHIFGYQGGAILKLVDSMVEAGMQYVQTYHEQAAALAADAYARVTGGLGAAIATSGPGATNLVTGIANAYFDSIPVLFITGQDYTSSINGDKMARQNGFQAVDVVGICRPITKYAKLIMTAEEVPFELEKALYMAFEGRPGPVLLDIPIDIQFKEIEVAAVPVFSPPITTGIQGDAVKSAADNVMRRLKAAKRPVILAGGGIRLANAINEFKDFADRTAIPVVTTLNALDCYEKAHSFSGLYGNTSANLIINNADVLLVLGSRLGLRQVSKFKNDYTNASVIQVDIDPYEQNRGLDSEFFVHSHLKPFLAAINELCCDQDPLASVSWLEAVRGWDEKYLANSRVNDDGVDPVALVATLTSLCTDDAIFTSDVGQNQMWVGQGFHVKGEQRLLNSSGHGAMGFSLPAAIGAKIAAPGRQVIAFTGDGGLQMNIQELLTLAHRRLGIKCVVFNNNTLGLMREVQGLYFGSRFYGSCEKDFICPDLKGLAGAYGLNYVSITDEKQVDNLASCLADSEPWIIDVKVGINSKVINRYDEKHVFEQEKIGG